MEVLSGNSSGPGQARRKQDSTPGDIRTLDWSSRPGDILLYPHSPLALVDVLNSEHGVFDLLPLQEGDEQDTHSASPELNNTRVVSIHSRKGRKLRERANLLTCHAADELKDRCKRALIDNALVKQPGQKRLFIIAGFLKWKANEEEKFSARSPLLFYPVILVNKRNRETHGEELPELDAETKAHNAQNYEVRLDGSIPELNPDLAMHCQRQWGVTLPEYSFDVPLPDYFAQVVEALSDNDTAELEFDIALGTAAPPAGLPNKRQDAQAQLPDLPKHFATQLAMAIAENKNLAELCTVLNLLDDNATDNINSANESSHVHDKGLSDLRELSLKLKSIGLDHLDFKTLGQITDSTAANINIAKGILGGKLITDILANPGISAMHVIRLAGVIELIDKFPMQLNDYRHSDLSYKATPALLRRARHQARLIEDELSALEEFFILDRIPSKPKLLSLIDELGVNHGHSNADDIVDATYFNARRQFMEFSVEAPTNLTDEHRRQLGQLAKVLRFRELFVNNTEYRMALGPGYRGLRTHWDQMEKMTEYSQELSVVLESEKHAASALGRWEEFRNTYVNELENLNNGSEAVQGLLRIAGKGWQYKPVRALIRHCQSVCENLVALLDQYGSFETHSNKTPAAILDQFTGDYSNDVRTEAQVNETQARIAEVTNNQQLSSEAISETLEWLRTASTTASELELDIDEILNHLNIA